MTTQPYYIAVDHASRLLDMKLSGIWDVETAHAFEKALRGEFALLRTSRRPFDVIADLREWLVQSQETTAIHEKLMAFGHECGMRNVALLVSSVLTKLQTLRMASSDHFQAFDDESEARAWIAQRQDA